MYIGCIQARLESPKKKFPIFRPTGPGGVRVVGSCDDQERGRSVDVILAAMLNDVVTIEELKPFNFL